MDLKKHTGPMYVDTPNGIFTASGIWFSTTEAQLKQYAAGVLDAVPIEKLIAHAETWLQSPKSLGVWMLGISLLFISPSAALFVGMAVWFTWRVFSPALVNRPLTPVLRLLGSVILQGGLFVVVLSLLGMAGATMAVILGVAGFVIIRWDLLERAAYPVLAKLWKRFYRLPVPDQILRLVVLRAAMAHGVSMPELDRMRRDIVEIMSQKK